MKNKDFFDLASILNAYIEEPFELFKLSQECLKSTGIKFNFIKQENCLLFNDKLYSQEKDQEQLFFTGRQHFKTYERESQLSSLISQQLLVVNNTFFNSIVSNPIRGLNSWSNFILIEGEEIFLDFIVDNKILKNYKTKVSNKGLKDLSFNRKFSFISSLKEGQKVDLVVKINPSPLKSLAINNLKEDGFLKSFRKENSFAKKQSLDQLKNLVRPNSFLSLYLFFSNPAEYVKPNSYQSLGGLELGEVSLKEDAFCQTIINKLNFLQKMI